MTKDEKKIVNVLINYKLRDWLHVTGDENVFEFYERRDPDKGILLECLSPGERDLIRELFKIKKRILDKK